MIVCSIQPIADETQGSRLFMVQARPSVKQADLHVKAVSLASYFFEVLQRVFGMNVMVLLDIIESSSKFDGICERSMTFHILTHNSKTKHRR